MKKQTKKLLFTAVITVCSFAANAQMNTPSNPGTVNLTSTNLGVGTFSPSLLPLNMLHINAPVPSSIPQDRLFRVSVDDARKDFFQITNGSISTQNFTPLLWGHKETEEIAPSLTLLGSTSTSKDNTSTNLPIMRFETRTYGVAADPTSISWPLWDPSVQGNVSHRTLFDWVNNGNEKMRLTVGGTLSVGNTNPNLSSSLDIGGDATLGSSAPGANRLLLHTRAWLNGDFFALVPGNETNWQFGNALYIVPGAGIGVGTGNIPAGAKFAVGGKMYAEQIVVKLQSNWPDFVFAKDHALMPINDLETYVNANKHLPGVPDQEEVACEGINVGDMQQIQMQKIEEMYLYMIKLSKENEVLKTKMAKMEALINQTGK